MCPLILQSGRCRNVDHHFNAEHLSACEGGVGTRLHVLNIDGTLEKKLAISLTIPGLSRCNY